MPARFQRNEYEDPKDMLKKVQEYIALCDSEYPKIFPDLAGMRMYLGINRKQMEAYQKDPRFSEIFEYAADARESFLVRTMSSDNKRAQGCLNALKQPENGSYADKPKDTEKKIVVEFRDTAIDASDFK